MGIGVVSAETVPIFLMHMVRLLMVCLGNICRSPMAEGILRHKAQERGIDIEHDSCGTSNYHIAEAPDDRAVDKMAQYGIDISDLRARQFKSKDFDEFDRIYVMDQSNYRDVIRMADSEEKKAKVKMILNEIHPGSDSPVPDPWFGGMDGFESVYQLLELSCDKILDHVK